MSSKTLYIFRCSINCGSNRFGRFIAQLSEAIHCGDTPPELRPMLESWDRSDSGYCSTSDKVIADTFLHFISSFDSWSRRGSRVHPMTLETLPIGGPDPRGR